VVVKHNDIQAVNCGAFSVLVGDGVGIAVSEPADVTVSGINILQGIGTLIDELDPLAASGVIRSYNTNAVKTPGTPDIIPGDPGGSEIWFEWSVPLLQSSGIVTFSTLGSDFDTTMGAYTGSEPTSLSQVLSAVNDDDAAGYLNSQVSFYAVKGATYLIAVDGFYGAQGNVVLSWVLNPGSSTLPNATPAPQSITASNGATVILNSPWLGNNCDWLFNGAVVATDAGALTIANLGQATVGSYVARFTTSDGIAVSAEPTEVQINTLQDGSTSTNSTAWIKYLDSANAAFVQPVPGKTVVRKLGGGGDSGGYSCSQVFSTANNSDEPGEPVVCEQNGSHPAWYSYVTPASGSLLISTAGSSFNTILGVFIGPGNSFSTLTNIGCGYTTNYQLDGQPSVCIPNVPTGQTNYIMVEGENGASGAVQLNIYLGDPISISSPPQSQVAGPGTNVTLAVSASGGTPISYAWQFNGVNINGATNGTLTISNMQSFAAGTYTVVMSNSVSVVTTQAVVGFANPVSISSAPQSQVAGPGTNVTLAVSASGGTPINYAWQFDGVFLDGATNSTLVITNMQASDTGTYTVVVSNLVSVVTAQAVVSFDNPVFISSPPQSQIAGPGTNVTLAVSASGSAPISYAWQFDGNNLDGATNATLTINNMQAFEAGTYTVVVSNLVSVVTAQAVVSFDNPVFISSPPQSQIAGPGTNVTLAVSASGSTPISYAWQFDGNNLDGATNATLTINNMQAFEAGTYTVVVSNLVSVVTAQAVVSFDNPVFISSPPQSQIAGPGTNVTLVVNASGSAPISYAWQFNGANLNGATYSTLTINNMQASDTGTYAVVVSNLVSVVTAQAVVSFGNPVFISSPPQSQIAGPGTNVTLAVSASGSAPMSYAWQFNGTNLNGATNSTLTISNMQASDTGTYAVVVSNLVSVVTAQAVVSFDNPVFISSPPQSQIAGPGTNVTLAVSASGSAPMSYTWQFNGANLNGATNSTLTISNMQASDTGTYAVVVSNLVSVVTAQAVVSFDNPVFISSPPQSQIAGPGTNVTLAVNASGSAPMSYTWQFDGAFLDGATNSILTITNMQASDAGTYAVVVSNSVSVVTAQAVVSFGNPISISSPPQSQIAGPGTNVTLAVSASGSAPISATPGNSTAPTLTVQPTAL
jgi:ABC-type transporter MlaC component